MDVEQNSAHGVAEVFVDEFGHRFVPDSTADLEINGLGIGWVDSG
jgi:hypothetical protein